MECADQSFNPGISIPNSRGYPPLNGATPVRYRTEFAFSARTVSLTVQS